METDYKTTVTEFCAASVARKAEMLREYWDDGLDDLVHDLLGEVKSDETKRQIAPFHASEDHDWSNSTFDDYGY